MAARTQRLYVWCGPVGMLLLFVGLIVARLLPLPAPTDDAARITAFLRDHATAVRLGGVIAMVGGAFLGPWAAALANQLRRMEGPGSPVASCQLVLGSFFVLEIIFPLMVLETAAFRPNQSPDVILALSDLCWIPFVGLAETFTVEALLLGIGILRDRADDPIFPRWMGWFSLAAVILTFPANTIVFFKTGPFAWDGAFGWWLVAGSFGSWLIGMTVIMLRSVHRAVGDGPEASVDAVSSIDAPTQAELARLAAEVDSLRRELLRRP